MYIAITRRSSLLRLLCFLTTSCVLHLRGHFKPSLIAQLCVLPCASQDLSQQLTNCACRPLAGPSFEDVLHLLVSILSSEPRTVAAYYACSPDGSTHRDMNNEIHHQFGKRSWAVWSSCLTQQRGDYDLFSGSTGDRWLLEKRPSISYRGTAGCPGISAAPTTTSALHEQDAQILGCSTGLVSVSAFFWCLLSLRARSLHLLCTSVLRLPSHLSRRGGKNMQK